MVAIMRSLHQQYGFSLVEVMVVLVIIGVMAATVSLSAQPRQAESLRLDAQELAQRLSAAQHEVRKEGRVIVWQPRENGYVFTRGVWRTEAGGVLPILSHAGRLDELTEDEILQPRQWRTDAVSLSSSQPVLLTAEWMGRPWRLELHSQGYSAILLRDGTGGYRVE